MRYSSVAMLAALVVGGCAQGDEPAAEEHAALQEESAGLLARAAIAPEQARAIALERAGGGTVTEAELEEEDGLLLYSFEVRQADGNVIEIEVDAASGEVVSEGEDDADDDDEDDDEDDEEHDDEDEHRGS